MRTPEPAIAGTMKLGNLWRSRVMDALARITQSDTVVPPSDEPLLRMEEIVRRYKGLVRRMARAKLSPPLRRLFESDDICNSVFRRVGEQIQKKKFLPEEKTWAQVCYHVKREVKHKIAELYRGRLARESKNVSIESTSSFEVVDQKAVDPARAAEDRDLYDALRALMSDKERLLVDLRNEGLDYNEIAQRMGRTPSACLMHYHRLVFRLARSQD